MTKAEFKDGVNNLIDNVVGELTEGGDTLTEEQESALIDIFGDTAVDLFAAEDDDEGETEDDKDA